MKFDDMYNLTEIVKPLIYSQNHLNSRISISDTNCIGRTFDNNTDLNCDEFKTRGVYVLFKRENGIKRLYIGETQEIKGRIPKHNTKMWWNFGIVLQGVNDTPEIKSIEAELIKAATLNEVRLNFILDNNKKHQIKDYDYKNKRIIEKFIENAVYICESIGIDVFSKPVSEKQVPSSVQTRQKPATSNKPNSDQTFEINGKILTGECDGRKSSWRGLYKNFLNELPASSYSKLRELAIFKTSAENIHSPYKITDNLYIDINLSKDSIINSMNKLKKLCT